jgi:HKD family nuclease
MATIGFIAQPAPRSALDAIDLILRATDITRMQIAAAYVTSKGVHDFVDLMSSRLGNAWDGIDKRWLTSFDYCRSEPVALQALRSLPSSRVRVHNAAFCLAHQGVPKTPFHPKAFFFESVESLFVLAGSGNLSRSGLSKGFEAGLVVSVDRTGDEHTTAFESIDALRGWFSANWNGAAPLNPGLLNSYEALFQSTSTLKHSVPTEDDIASSDTRNGTLSGKDLQKLRVCKHFWIEAGNITRNRGPQLPGNQLMMKRLSRVFFGFDAVTVPENTFIGNVSMRFNGGPINAYSLTYSDNGMDKLTLPIPGAGGPAMWDNRNLLFTRDTPTQFTVTLGTRATKARWSKASKAIDAAFKMTSGREWGVFS